MKNVLLAASQYANAISIVSLPAGANTLVFGGVSDDSVTVGTASSDHSGSLDSIGGPLTIDLVGGAGNQLRLVDFGDANGNHSVNVTATQVLGLAGKSDNRAVNYAATGGALALTIDGSDAATSETFTLNAPGAALTINANSGSDKVNVNALVHPATVFGGAGDDVLTLGFATHTLAAFISPLTFHGDAGIDTLAVNDKAAPASDAFGLNATSISFGGVGIASFDPTLENARVFAGPFADTFSTTGTPVLAGTVAIDGGLGANELVGSNASNVWNITATDVGTLNGKVLFAKIGSLTGGSGDDRFVFAPGKGVSGKIDGGGGGQDALDYSSATTGVVVNLLANTSTGIAGGIANIGNAIGGTRADILVGNALANILQGGAGRDILIGGIGGDSLDGGAEDDLLIGGTTDHDGNAVALHSLLAEWNSSHDYGTRLAKLRSGGGLNGPLRLDQTTVHDDAIPDTLLGGAGTDWFHARLDASPASDTTDLLAPELNG